MTVFGRFLRDRRRSTLWWALGVAAMIALTLAFYPSIEGQASFDDMAEQMPETVRELFGVDEVFGMASPQGYLWSQLHSTMLPILLLVFGIAVGARAIGGSEEDGTLELLLAQPVTRGRVVLERYGTLLVLHLVLVVVMVVATLLVGVPVGVTDGIPLVWLLGSFAAVLALGLLHGTLAFAVGALTGRRGRAIAVSAAVAVVGYVLEGLGSATDALRPLQVLSPFHWLLVRNMLGTGMSWQAVWLPLVLCGALVVVSVRLFDRRDLR